MKCDPVVPQMLKTLTHWVHICSTPRFPRLPRNTPSSPLVHTDWSHRVCPRYKACLSLQLDTKQPETCIYIILWAHYCTTYIYIYTYTCLYIIVYGDTVIMYIYIYTVNVSIFYSSTGAVWRYFRQACGISAGARNMGGILISVLVALVYKYIYIPNHTSIYIIIYICMCIYIYTYSLVHMIYYL